MINYESFYFNATIGIIIFQLVVFYYRLSFRMLVHPGFFFAAIWLFSVFSQNLLMSFELALVKDLDSIRELNIFVSATSLFFSFWVLTIKTEIKSNLIFNINLNIKYYKILIIVTLISSIVLMLYTWSSLGIASLNLAHIRDLNTRDKANYFGTSSNIFLSILKYLQSFYPIISILSGYFLGRIYLFKEKKIFNSKYLYIPLVISLIYVFTNGGRNPLFVGVKYYFVGLCFAMPSVFSSADKNWLLKRVSISFLILALFSTIVSDSRGDYYGGEIYSKKFNNPILSSLSGGIEYAGAHYYGYQLRNVDTFDANNLGYGYFTFYSIFDIRLPFSNYFNFNGTLGNFFGFSENPIDYFYLWENDLEGYFTTNSVYLGLKLDFGFVGSLIFLFFYTYYTHFLFLKVSKGRGISFYTIFWFLFCFEFWASSNFKSSYSSGFVSSFVIFFLFSKLFILKKKS